MNDRLYLGSPLGIEGWEVIERLEGFALFEEFRERLEDALAVIHEGQALWADHLDSDGVWSEQALCAVADVRRQATSILQRLPDPMADFATSIRWSVRWSADVNATDAQCVAALALDRACRAIETLAAWLADFDADLGGDSSELLSELAKEAPQEFAVFLADARLRGALAEVEARERAADLLGVARHYMTLARVYESPLMSSQEKSRISAAASKAGRHSAEVRQGAAADRNKAICAHGRRLLQDGRAERDLVGIILGTDSALKSPGGQEKLSAKQIRNILRLGGVIPGN